MQVVKGSHDNDSTIAFGESLVYECKNGMKFVDDPMLSNITAECQEGNIWKPEIDWQDCVESKLLNTNYLFVDGV